MAKKIIITKGYAHTRKSLEVPDSPEGFEWPAMSGAKAATKEERQRFAGALNSLIQKRGLNHMEFAGQFLGEKRSRDGQILKRAGAANVRRWLTSDSWPTDMTARRIASFFGVPMAALLQYDGPPIGPIYLRVPAGVKMPKKKANGHDVSGIDQAAAAAVGGPPLARITPELPPQPVKPPKGAKPVTVELKTLPDDPSWAHVTVAGTMPLDVGLGLLAYMERHKTG
jgi:hypothetical protein